MYILKCACVLVYYLMDDMSGSIFKSYCTYKSRVHMYWNICSWLLPLASLVIKIISIAFYNNYIIIFNIKLVTLIIISMKKTMPNARSSVGLCPHGG